MRKKYSGCIPYTRQRASSLDPCTLLSFRQSLLTQTVVKSSKVEISISLSSLLCRRTSIFSFQKRNLTMIDQSLLSLNSPLLWPLAILSLMFILSFIFNHFWNILCTFKMWFRFFRRLPCQRHECFDHCSRSLILLCERIAYSVCCSRCSKYVCVIVLIVLIHFKESYFHFPIKMTPSSSFSFVVNDCVISLLRNCISQTISSIVLSFCYYYYVEVQILQQWLQHNINNTYQVIQLQDVTGYYIIYYILGELGTCCNLNLNYVCVVI